MNLYWKRPLVYCLMPLLVFLAFVGFPLPLAPLRALKPGQEHSQAVGKKGVNTPSARP